MSQPEFEQYLNTPACQVENYSYKHPFSERWVLQNINCSIRSGETVAVFGDSGSGKTTLFASLTGFNHHFYRGGEHRGSIRLFGERVDEVDIFRLARLYGLVSQDFRNQLLVDQVASAVAFPMENQAVPHNQMHQRVNEILTSLELSDLKERNVSQLSGGEGQAVVIASMLAKEPQLMIFDDVASDLDQRGQESIREIIKELKGQGIAMAIVDSSAPEWLLREIADRILILDEGQQVYFGAPENISQNIELMQQLGVFIPQVEFRELVNSPVAVSIEGVSFAYDGKLAVENVSCKINKNSITGIIGHNGSGKTTLAKMVAGLYKPMEGEIKVNGIKPHRLPAKQAVCLVSYLPQNTEGMFFTETVEQELKYTPRVIGSKPIITSEMIGLSNLEAEHPEFLSAGQRERLALGCALSSNPRILILDEPTKGLNQKERLALVTQLIEMQRRGKTIILISHDWPMIARAANNVLVLDNGHSVRQGPTREVLQDKEFFEKLGLPLPW